MKAKTIAPLCALVLSGCGTTPGVNSDVPNAVYIAGRPTPADTSGVVIVQAAPIDPGQTMAVSGVSCKNKLWDPAPDRDNAVALMKNQAAKNGFNAIYGVEVGADGKALAMNCWAAITARGTAFNLAADSGI